MEPNSIKAVLQFILNAAGGLSIVVALILYGTSKWTSHGDDGLSDARLIGCILAAVAFFAASVFVGTLNFNYA